MAVGSSPEWRYTRGEAAYLLSISHDDAIGDDVAQPDSCSHLSPDGPMPSTTHVEWDPVMAIARWNDVQRARRAVLGRRPEPNVVRILERRLAEQPVRDVAAALDLDPMLVQRRFRSTIDEILDELGGEAIAGGAMSRAPACMKCARRPRARYAERRVKRAGRPPRIVAERQSSLCWWCAPEKVRRQLIPCEQCGLQPRGRLREMVVKREGKPPKVLPERDAPTCVGCAPARVRRQMIGFEEDGMEAAA